MAVITFLYGSIIEAWSEFRTHRARVLMSLIGVAIAVTALTGVAAISAVAQQSIIEGLERGSGRPVTLQINAYNPTSGASTDGVTFSKQVADVMDRYGIRYWSRNEQGSVTLQTPQGAVLGNVNAVDPPYGTMHRVRLAEGSWFTERDARRLAPAVIVDSVTWKSLGSPDLRTDPAITLLGTTPTTAVIVGVTPGGYEGSPQLMMLVDGYDAIVATQPQIDGQPANQYFYEAWIPTANWNALQERISSALSAQVGDGFQVDVQRQDYQAYQTDDPLLIFKIMVGAAAGLILLLGALGLLNISLVTVRGRIREIGIRRSFGATAGRVFFGVMMESVVATLAAGAIGVAIAILLLKNPITTGFIMAQGLQDVPPFPISAALIGLAAAAGVGALAGLLPALVAVRVRPIDAIRY